MPPSAADSPSHSPNNPPGKIFLFWACLFTDANGFRKPFVLQRKGAAFAQSGVQSLVGLSFFPGTIGSGGASGIGVGSVAGGGLPIYEMFFSDRQLVLYKGGFNN
ncbi:MAG: hypothetical protein JNK37_09605 [Verrucomicrobiales bacterium]|nr:hypothetical protein [Verrucomicrobiales bacterium]